MYSFTFGWKILKLSIRSIWSYVSFNVYISLLIFCFYDLFWLTEMDLLSLKGSTVSSSIFWGVYGLDMAFGSLSASVQCCVSVLLKDYVGVSGHWCLLAFGWAWFWCWDGGSWEGSHLLMFPEVMSSLMGLGLGLSSQVFRLSAYWSSKTSQATQHKRQVSNTLGEGKTQEPRTPSKAYSRVL